MEKVSIVLPTFNGERNIRQALDSIIKQTYNNWELIIVNDCSTDNTINIINEYANNDQRIKIINNDINLKLPKSLNIGFKYAEGTYFTWTSDDNIFKENAISCMVHEIEKDKTIGLVYCNYTLIDSDGKIIESIKLSQPDKMPVTNPIGACFLYRKCVAEKVGEYDEKLFLAEDYDYWIRIYKVSKIKHIDKDLYFYRKHENSLTATKKEDIRKQTFKLLEKHFLFLYFIAKEYRNRKWNVLNLYDKRKMTYGFFDKMIKCADENDKKRLICTFRNMQLGYSFKERNR